MFVNRETQIGFLCRDIGPKANRRIREYASGYCRAALGIGRYRSTEHGTRHAFQAQQLQRETLPGRAETRMVKSRNVWMLIAHCHGIRSHGLIPFGLPKPPNSLNKIG